jgi:hypothetical protein
MSGKTSGEMSRVISAQFPGNGRAVTNAMPPDDRIDDSQDNSQQNAQWSGKVRVAIRATANATSRETSRKLTRRHPAVMFSTIPF